MSWSFSASGEDRDSTLQAFRDKQTEDKYCPIPEAILAAAEALAYGFARTDVRTITTSGHVDTATGKGSASVSISST